MTGSIYDWSTTAASNATADGDINWAEGQPPDTVNNSARQMMGRHAEWIDNLKVSRASTGGANTYATTGAADPGSWRDGLRGSFRAHQTNTGASTISYKTYGSKPLRRKSLTALLQGEIESGATINWVYASDTDECIIVSGTSHFGGASGDVYARLMPVGTVLAWATEAIPLGYLECDGSAQSRTTYPELFTALGTRYGAGDGSTTFNLPDYRGQFLRGHANGQSTDPDRASRTNRGDGTTGDAVGTKQTDSLRGHTHSVPQVAVTGTVSATSDQSTVLRDNGTGLAQGGTSTGPFARSGSSGTVTITNAPLSNGLTTATTTGSTGGNQTTPTNISVKLIILAKPSLAAANVIGVGGIAYQYDSTITASDPGNGKLRFNNATPGSATVIYADNLDYFGATINAVLTSIPSNSQIYIYKVGTPSTYVYFTVGASATQQSGYVSAGSLTAVASGGSFSDGDIIVFAIYRGGGGSGVTVNSTTITGGTNGRVLYDNAGAVGELATTGSGNAVLATSPTLVAPALGTPSAATLTNATGLPISTGVSGLATGAATFLATPTSANLAALLTDETGTGASVFATSPTLVTPALGTPTALTLTNATGLPLSTGVSGTLPVANGGTGVTTATGTGNVVLSTSPTLVTPVLGVASATTINKVSLTAPASGATLTIADGKTLTASNTITLAGTDGSTLAIGSGGTLAASATTDTTNAGNISSGTLSVARGGTGVNGSAAANGSLLIGNGTGYTAATLTAGTNVTITNAAGGITIAASGSTVTIGATSVASGTAGRVLYETAGNLVGEVSTLTFDGTSLTFSGTGTQLAGRMLATYAGSSGGAGNLAIGAGTDAAGPAITTGTYNIMLGRAAGRLIAAGGNNVAIGLYAMWSNVSGNGNVAVGPYAYQQGTGSSNVAIGNSAMTGIGSSSNNIAIGPSALSSGTTAQSNVCIGPTAGQNITSGQLNVCIGNGAGVALATAIENTAVGNGVLTLSTVNYNSGFGAHCLYQNTTGSSLAGLGANAMYYNSTGARNTACGYDSLKYNQTGGQNTAVGQAALLGVLNNSFDNNTGVGDSALTHLTTGSGNTALGQGAGQGITTGSNNTLIGRTGSLSATLANTIIIADGAGNVGMQTDANGHTTFRGVVKTLSTVVGSLPSASAVGAGARAFVTDATATTYLATVAGGGSNKVPVVSDGTNWLIG